MSILSCSWGSFLIVAGGLLSLAFDLLAARSGNVLGMTGNAIIGWLVVALLFVLPSALMRSAGKAPIRGIFAVIWCLVASFGWLAIKTIDAPAGSSHTKVSFVFIGGVILCWQLLTQRSEDTVAN